MITVETKEILRREVLVEGQSIRAVARQNGCSRETVKRALLDPLPSVYHMKQARRSPVMDPFREVIDNWLLEDRQRPAKQRHTAHRIYERLRGAPYHFAGAEITVRRFVRQRKSILGIDQPEAFIPLEFAPGQDAQCDFGEAQVIIAGQQLTAQYLVMTLCYSTLPFVMAFPHQRQEALFEGHVAAFEFFGGYMRNRQLRDVRARNRATAGCGPKETLAAADDDPRGRREGSIQPIHLSFRCLVALTAARFSPILGLTQEEGERVRSTESISSFS